MKIIELEIHNVRGIKDVALKPDSKNLVIWGGNGSGKSAVVDALDFLFTGRITRLTGRGTGSVKLKEHGPHVDHEPREASVKALIELPEVENPVQIERCFSNPGKLLCEPDHAERLEKIAAIARRGQHVLTRREILRYITVEASTRADEIQTLLDLQDVEATRKALVKSRTASQRSHKNAVTSLQQAKGNVASEVQLAQYEESKVLDAINASRLILGGEKIEGLDSSALKMGITAPRVVADKEDINATIFEKQISHLHDFTSVDSLQTFEEQAVALRTVLLEIHAEPERRLALRRLELVQLGTDLIEQSGDCPLCDTEWEPGELLKHLEAKISEANIALSQQNLMKQNAGQMMSTATSAVSSLDKIIQATGSIAELVTSRGVLKQWRKRLNRLINDLSSPLDRFLAASYQLEEVQSFFAPAGVAEALNLALKIVKDKYPESTPEQVAWDTLTGLEVSLRALEKAQADHERDSLVYRRASKLLDSYLQARDAVLNNLYSEISSRFSYLYRQLHGPDEAEFEARLEADEAALNFEVDFYGRGKHPPNALHSEGHQDSMGICLYLALAERLSEGLIDIIVLDDVVMSVDVNHRRRLCRVLTEEFPGHQFVITTHDKTWAKLLQTGGVVNSRGSVEFYNWSIDTGPHVNYEPGMWAGIETCLESNDVAGAAGKLRRGSEEFFTLACDSLAASVVFKMDGRWDLGDLLPSAYSQFGKLLRKAKAAAQSWGKNKEMEKLAEIESVAKQVYSRTQVEQWGVNASIHYNGWSNLTPAEFRPIVEAFHDLHLLFTCAECGSLLHLTTIGKDPVSVSCSCGETNWHLQKRR